MPEELDRQSIIDEVQLKLLSLGYMVSAGISAFFCLLGLIYLFFGVIVGVAISHTPASAKSGQPPPAFIGWIVAGVGLVILLIGAVVALARIWAARCVKQRKSRTFCMVVAAMGCLEFPYGTALGVLSLMLLGRESVARQFNAKPGE